MVYLKKIIIDQIDEQTLAFLNLVENFSISDDDLISIIDRANQYIKEPLHGIMNDFIMEVKLNADMNTSFEHLFIKLKGTKLNDVFKNLQICSEHGANYSSAISDARNSVKAYMSSKHIRKAVLNSARVDMAALFISGFVVINILNSFLSSNVFLILFSSPVGIGIICYCLAVLFYSVYYLFWR